jgi:curved DNA-binding protein CbpA
LTGIRRPAALRKPAPTLYRTLGVPPGWPTERIHARYRELAVEFHPDKNGGAESERFKEVALAWGVLKDPERRALYDQQLKLEGVLNCFKCGGRGLMSGWVAGRRIKDAICSVCGGKGSAT